MPSNGRTGTRGKRKGRIDYRKLNQGGTAPKPDGEEKKEKKKTSKKEVQKKEPSSKSKSKSIGNCEVCTVCNMLPVFSSILDVSKTEVLLLVEVGTNSWICKGIG